MKKTYFLFLIIISSISYSQSIDETINWINNNSNGRHKVIFIKKTNKIQLIKINIIPGVIKDLFYQEFNPYDVETISAPTKNNDWNDIVFTFKKGGSEVVFFTIIDNNKTPSNKQRGRGRSISADIMSDEKMILRYKKAYLHLFKKLGINVKDGDFF